jgi:hypothetical protein
MPLINIDTSHLHGKGKKVYLVALLESEPGKGELIPAQIWLAKSIVDLNQQMASVGLKSRDSYHVGNISDDGVKY